MAGFTEATELQQVDPVAGADASFSRELDPQWAIGAKPHGGYLLALLGRAATLTAGRAAPHVCAASAHYLRAPDVGPVRLDVQVLRRGRTATQTQVSLVAGGRLCVRSLLTLGTLTAAPRALASTLAPPALPPKEQCLQVTNADAGGALPFRDVVEQWLDPACCGWASGAPSGRPDVQGWLTVAGEQTLDPLALLMLVDALPPATFDLGTQGWVPTIELTAYCRALPTSNDLLVRQRIGVLTAERVDEVCEVFDHDGVLLAQGTQYAGVRMPEQGR